MEVHPKVSNGRSQTFVCFHCPLVAAAAKSPARGKNRLRLKDQLLGRAHLARHSINVEKSKLWARLRTRKVTGRDASLPAPFVGHVWHTGRPRNGWGVAPSPTRGAASGLRKGHCPLTLFLRPGLSAFPLWLIFAAECRQNRVAHLSNHPRRTGINRVLHRQNCHLLPGEVGEVCSQPAIPAIFARAS